MGSTKDFLAAKTFAVAGASRNRNKYGYKVFNALLQSGRPTVPINLTASEVDGHTAYASISDLPTPPESVSIITPPLATRKIVEAAIQAGVKNIWMQPGAEDADASRAAREAGINVIDDGSCVLVLLAREP